MEIGTKSSFDSDVTKLLKTIATKYGFQKFNIKPDIGSVKGEGYLGMITGAMIEDNDKVLNLVVKCAYRNNLLRIDSTHADIFKREMYMYEVVIPTFHKLESAHGVPLINIFAKYYAGSSIYKKEMFALENLKSQGFKLCERQLPLEKDHVILVLKEFGHFHALSFALKQQQPAVFHKMAETLDDVFVTFFSKKVAMFKNHCLKGLDSLCQVNNQMAYNVFKKFSESVEEFFFGLLKCVDEYSVIIHGDGWINNLMFKYADKNNSQFPTTVRFIDMQFARLASPVLDVAYFFYTCCSKSMIDDFHHYLDIYYSSLSVHLKLLGCNPDALYPRSIFWQQWKESAKFGLMMATFLHKFMLSEDDELLNIGEVVESGKDEVEVFCYDIVNIKEYQDRLKHIILHFVDNEFL